MRGTGGSLYEKSTVYMIVWLLLVCMLVPPCSAVVLQASSDQECSWCGRARGCSMMFGRDIGLGNAGLSTVLSCICWGLTVCLV